MNTPNQPTKVALIGRGTESAWVDASSDTRMANHIRHGWVVIWSGPRQPSKPVQK